MTTLRMNRKIATTLAVLACATSGCSGASDLSDCPADEECPQEAACPEDECGQSTEGSASSGSATPSADDPTCVDSFDCDDYRDGYAVCVVGASAKKCQYIGANCKNPDFQSNSCVQADAECWGGGTDELGQCLFDSVNAASTPGVNCSGPEDCPAGAYCVENFEGSALCKRPAR